MSPEQKIVNHLTPAECAQLSISLIKGMSVSEALNHNFSPSKVAHIYADILTSDDVLKLLEA